MILGGVPAVGHTHTVAQQWDNEAHGDTPEAFQYTHMNAQVCAFIHAQYAVGHTHTVAITYIHSMRYAVGMYILGKPGVEVASKEALQQ